MLLSPPWIHKWWNSVSHGGNDQLDKKYFAIMVHFWSVITCQTIIQFLAMHVCNVSTAAVLFEALENELESRGIPCPIWWDMLRSDGASVMVGAHNSLWVGFKLSSLRYFLLDTYVTLHHCVLQLHTEKASCVNWWASDWHILPLQHSLQLHSFVHNFTKIHIAYIQYRIGIVLNMYGNGCQHAWTL